MGLPAEMQAELEGAETPPFEVWPENMPIVEAFLAVSTQWNTTSLIDGRVHHHGLRYADAVAGLAQAAIVLTPAQWSGLRRMERAAAAALNGIRG